MIDQPAINALGLNSKQAATMKLLLEVAIWTRISAILLFLGGDILLAKEKLLSTVWLSSALEDDQWQKEVENIHNTSMAFLQRRVIDHVSPATQLPHLASLRKYFVQETTPEALHLCANQKIWSTNHYSFSMMGIFLILLGGIVVILVDVSLPYLIGWLQRRNGKGMAARLDWIESESLQLQRIAFEGRGIGPWKGKVDGVPVTTKFGQKFRRIGLHPGDNITVELTEHSNPLIESGNLQGSGSALPISNSSLARASTVTEGGRERDGRPLLPSASGSTSEFQ
jgi:hypothetical protein